MILSKRTTIIETTAVLFIILFLYTAISKLMQYSVFKEQIAISPLLAPVAPIVSALLPWIELAVVILLIVPRWRKKGLYASLALMNAFTAYIVAILTFSKDIPCSCGGIIDQLSWNQHIVFNSVFILLGLIAVILENRERLENKKSLASLV